MNICLETFGCRLNRAESLEDEASCLALGHRIVKTHSDADLIIVRGCSVTGRAQRDCEHLLAHLKRKYPNKRVVIRGCLAGASKTLTLPASGKARSTPSPLPPLPTRTARAYLKVQDGCAGKCTFCIVPKFRGESVSTPFDDVLAKASRFIESDYREIVITGCNLALYASNGKRLPDLLDALATLNPQCRIRLGSLEPWGPAAETIEAMAAHENLCRFLHLPVQSGSDRILSAMNRPYKTDDVTRLVELARKLMPDIGLGCDLMTGFPGESESDFMQTKTLLTRLAFMNAHVFPFSQRPGTPADKMPGSIQHSIRTSRAHTLSTIAKANLTKFARRFIGRDVAVVIESADRLEGWTGEYLWFKGPVHLVTERSKLSSRKKLLHFTVRSADNGILHGVLNPAPKSSDGR